MIGIECKFARVLFDNNNENVVVLGPQALRRTRLFYQRNYSYNITDEEIDQILTHAFSADRALILDNPNYRVATSAGSRFFHIDQTFFFKRRDSDNLNSGNN